jgi:uncharacterized iron-regulated protein
METSTTRASVYLLGDTEHSNPAIKREVAARLPALRAEGYTALALELDASKQPLMDALLSAPRTKEDITAYVRDTLKAKNVEGISSLITAAIGENMHILCIDEKRGTEEIDAQFPDFRTLRGTFNLIYHTLGDGVEQATLHALRESNPKQFLDYIDAYNAWKHARMATDRPMAEAIAARVGAGEKMVVVVGQSHLARPDGIPAWLERAGISTFHEDIYTTQEAYASFLQRTFESGEQKQIPPCVYVLDAKRRLDTAERTATFTAPSTQQVSVVEHHPVRMYQYAVANSGL